MVKIIIDIDEYDYEWIKNAYAIPNEINIKIAESIINSIPLDDIKAEIYQRSCRNYGSGFGHGLDVAIEIIDRHIGERSNDEADC